MRLAVLADVHGNLPALEAALHAVSDARVDQLIVAGDVLPGPMPAQSLDLLTKIDLPIQYVSGNGERETLRAVDGLELATVPPPYRPPVEWCAAELRSEQVAFVRQWPGTLGLDVPGIGRVLVCHATPRSDTEIFTRATPEARVGPAFAGVTAALVLCGHTHMAFERVVAGLRVVNAGSVGMPFGEPGAHWLLIDDKGTHFVRTPYDLEAAAARIRATSYPGADAFATNHVLRPPGEDTMIAAFERT